jgi:hypothetical protein
MEGQGGTNPAKRYQEREEHGYVLVLPVQNVGRAFVVPPPVIMKRVLL